MPLGRTFSFENNDEGALSHNEQDRFFHHSRNDSVPQADQARHDSTVEGHHGRNNSAFEGYQGRNDSTFEGYQSRNDSAVNGYQSRNNSAFDGYPGRNNGAFESYESRNHSTFEAYHDSPPRDIISPPPQYSSPPPDEPPSPIMSPTPPPRRQHPYATPSHTLHDDDAAAAVHEDASYEESRSVNIPRVPLPPGGRSDDSSPPPPPPPHRQRPSADTAEDGRHWGQQVGHLQSSLPLSINAAGENVGAGAEDRRPTRRGADNTDHYRRDSFSQAPGASGIRPEYHTAERGRISPNSEANTPQRINKSYPPLRQRDSNSSGLPLAAGAATPGSMTPGAASDLRSSGVSGRSIPLEDYPTGHAAPGGLAAYHDSPYQTSSVFHSQMNDANINPHNIADDGDDGFMPDPRRRSMLTMGRQSSNQVPGPTGAGAAPMGGVNGVLGGLMGRKQKAQVASGSYNAVEQTRGTGNGLGPPSRAEKSEWLSRQTKGNNKMRWVVGFAIGTVVVLAIIGGIVGGVLGSKNSSSSGSGNNSNTAAGDTAANGDLGSNSPEIQALMNNPNLHKVFPGIDYTPWGTQYPLCMTYPPSQNNVTRDMAVLSQLTNAVRLYGTDCNQTEMTLHAIDRLGLQDMKLWLGVWIDTNQTTTDRQFAQMYKILEETTDHSIFKGAIIGNEALYRAGVDKASSEASLIQILTDVKSNFTAKGWNIPVATSDLGDNWNGQLVDVVDMVMANIHPFFAGVTAEVAAGWTWDFWQQHDVVLTQGTNKQQIISETGWPSAGGTDCGGTTGDCAAGQSGSIAGITEMNTFMDNFVCQAMANGTDYFW